MGRRNLFPSLTKSNNLEEGHKVGEEGGMVGIVQEERVGHPRGAEIKYKVNLSLSLSTRSRTSKQMRSKFNASDKKDQRRSSQDRQIGRCAEPCLHPPPPFIPLCVATT